MSVLVIKHSAGYKLKIASLKDPQSIGNILY